MILDTVDIVDNMVACACACACVFQFGGEVAVAPVPRFCSDPRRAFSGFRCELAGAASLFFSILKFAFDWLGL